MPRPSQKTKHVQIVVRPGSILYEEDAHEFGWDVDLIREKAAALGVHLAEEAVYPCDCEPCRAP